MELDSATCAENFYTSASKAEGYVSGFTARLAEYLVTWPAVIFGNMAIGTILGLFSFGILGAAYLPVVVLTIVGGYFALFVVIAFPNMALVARYHLISMKGYYKCAIGEDGFTDEGFKSFMIAYSYIMASLNNFDLFTTIPFGALFNNGGLVKDLDAMLLEYVQA